MIFGFSSDEKIEIVLTENLVKDFNLHVHINHYVFSIILDGYAELLLNNVKMKCDKADIFIVRPFIPHSVKTNKDSKILSVCIQKDLIENFSLNREKLQEEVLNIISAFFEKNKIQDNHKKNDTLHKRLFRKS